MRRNIRRVLLYLIIATALAQSCRHRDAIPDSVMSEIYYDIYMTDQAVRNDARFRRMTDTLRIYEPVFNKYGYTTEDYTRTVNELLLKPEKLEKIFEETKMMLEKREAQLKLILEAEGKRSKKWTAMDSLEILTADGVHSERIYMNLRMMFFQADSTVPSSPVPDTAFMQRPRNPFLIFSDSALTADNSFEFYRTLGLRDDLRFLKRRKREEAEDTVTVEKELVVPATQIIKGKSSMSLSRSGKREFIR